MVVYPERWMAQVDTMKSLQGWTDTSIIHFGNLARFGEQLLLSIRFDDWNDLRIRPRPMRPTGPCTSVHRYKGTRTITEWSPAWI